MRIKRFFKSVFSRYSLSLIAIILVSFLLLILIFDFVIGNYYTDIREKELSRLSSSGGELIRIDYLLAKEGGADWLEDAENRKRLWERVLALYHETDMFIMVTDAYGVILDTSVTELRKTEVSSSINDTVNQKGFSSGVSDCGVFEERHFYYAQSIYDKETHIATVYACIPMSLVRAPVNAIMRLIVIVCLWVMFAALLAAYFISEKITRPLAKMSKAAKAFSDGDFSVRVPVKGGDEIAEFALVFNDMADSLENMEKTRNDFIANVSHDLRSPMTSITGFLDGMITGVIPPEKHEHYLRIVLNETKRLSRLVATLLDISKIQAGERKFRMVHFDICEMARQIIISFENRIEEKNLDVNFESDADRMYVCADMDAIYQVLYNLCDNATKFAADGKKFTVSICEKDGTVTVNVYNEGDGIAKEDLKMVFDRFYKGDKSRGMDKSGTGLGLYISQKIIEAHKQKISVESTYGEFCCFSFTLEKGERPIRGKANDRLIGK